LNSQINKQINASALSEGNYTFKIIILGDYQSGKSSLIQKFLENTFTEFHHPTVGFKIIKKTLIFEERVKVNLIIWDTGGLSSQVSPLREKILKNADAVIIVKELKSHINVRDFKKWFNQYIEDDLHEIPISIAGNKADLHPKLIPDASKYIGFYLKENNFKFYYNSAKTGKNVDILFNDIIKRLIDRKDNLLNQPSNRYSRYNLNNYEIDTLQEIEKLIFNNSKNPHIKTQYDLKKLKRNGLPRIYSCENDSFGIVVQDGTLIGLGLFNCDLKDLPTNIKNLKFLKKLTLKCNPLGKVPETLFQLKNLEFLDLSLTNISNLPEDLKDLKNLKSLHLENNYITSLPDQLGHLDSLEHLNIENNPLNELPDSICDLRHLKSLYLEAPPIFYKGTLNKLPSCIGNLISLEVLDLSSCELQELPDSIGKLDSLKVLDLYENKLLSIPNSIGELKQLEIINLENNQLKELPDSIGDLVSLKRILLKGNPLNIKGSSKFQSMALKSSGSRYDRLMQIASKCKIEEEIGTHYDKIIDNKRILRSLIPFLYAGIIALIGLITFSIIDTDFLVYNTLLSGALFLIAISINFLIGLCIIASVSKYFKLSTLMVKQKAFKIFDIFVMIYLIWSIRAAFKALFSIELIPSVNIAFEFAVPDSMLEILQILGYHLDLSFLDNIDLFFGHYYFKIFSTALVFWALYKNGLTNARKTAYEAKGNNNIFYFLIIGLFGAIILAIMDYSNLKQFINIGYNLGVIIGATIFIWDNNKDHLNGFYIYMALLIVGITTCWLLSLFNIIIYILFSVVFIILYFTIRKIQHKKLSQFIY